MPSASAGIDRLTKFYAALSPSLDSIMALLSAAGVDTSEVRARDLYERDLDCHNMGMHSMLEVLADVASEYGPPQADQVVLDIGCGLGGPGRFLVDRFGCSVVGIDVVPRRVERAQELSELTGMSHRATYRVADATSIDFADRSFSHVWMLDVSIHIRHKSALFGEIARVLEPGGLFVMHDQTGPLPQAMTPVTEQAPYYAPALPRLVRYVEDAGMRLLTWRDTTPRVLDFFVGLRSLVESSEPATRALDPEQRDHGAAVLSGYIETLSGPDGRTGILLARKPR